VLRLSFERGLPIVIHYRLLAEYLSVFARATYIGLRSSIGFWRRL
jgi:hypothetical protein